MRKEKGQEIAKKGRIVKNGNKWEVPSQSSQRKYLVYEENLELKCTCPDYEMRQCKCKHIWAVEISIRTEIDNQGNKVVTKTVKISYGQNWKAYNEAQQNEGTLFQKLLADLCQNVPQPEYVFGRPKMPYSDIVFSSALKVYSTFSLRRFMTDMKQAVEQGFIENPCSYVTVSNYMRSPKLTPILQELIKLSSLPLATIETKFGVDSSGFGTCRFARYFSFKHGRDMKYKVWLKAHIISGTKTNIVTGVEVSEENKNDSPFFKPLVERTAENFQIKEVMGDKAYSSRDNMDIVVANGGTPFIPYKSIATGKARGSMTWKKMYHYFLYRHEEFLQHYHQRSNSETVFHMIKTKFKDNLRSKDKIAQINELLLKVLCHNICVLIQEMHELGIKPEF